MSIEVRNIVKLFGKQRAVNDISFSVAKGEVAGFIGPNGAGKSTTMKIITGYLRPTSGEAFAGGYSAVRDSLGLRKLIGYLPENNPLYPEMYVREYLSYVLDLYPMGLSRKDKLERINRAVEMTGLGREQHKKIGSLSKGYKQRTGLAQAIIHEPQVLILDEPTSGLDPTQIVEIRNLIKELGKEKTVLLSTHIMQEVEAICDRVIMISRGEIKADGKAGDISSAMPETQLTIVAEFDANPDLKKLTGLPGILDVQKTAGGIFLISAFPDPDPRQTVFDFAVGEGLKVLSLQKKEKSLEEVFRELTS